jgi:uncharacterized protein YdaU (DUF1376 family)
MALQYMPFYFGDYWRDTAHLTDSEHVAYLRLISYYWYQGSLPKDDKRLAAITMRPLTEWLDMKPTIQDFFEDGWVHGRIERDLKKQKAEYQAKVDGGKYGAAKRWANRSPNGIPNGSPIGTPNGSTYGLRNGNQNQTKPYQEDEF